MIYNLEEKLNDSAVVKSQENDFKTWLAVYFIKKGLYKITSKAVETFSDEVYVLHSELAESSNDKNREHYIYKITKEKLKNHVGNKIYGEMKKGNSLNLYLNGFIVSKNCWENKDVRIEVTRKLVSILNKNPKEIVGKDFIYNGLTGMINHYFKGSPYLAFKEAGLANFEPWEMKKGTQGYWKNKDNRIKAVMWLVKKLDKNPKDIGVIDFQDNCLTGLINNYYKTSPYLAFKEAGLVNFEPWEMKKATQRYWKNKDNRIKAVMWLVKRMGKDPREIGKNDFCDNNLDGLLVNYFKGSPYFAFKEAGLANFEPWEMNHSPNKTFNSKENRINAMKWLVDKIKKNPKEVNKEDFCANGLGGLIDHHENSPYLALKEARLVKNIKDMKRKPHSIIK